MDSELYSSSYISKPGQMKKQRDCQDQKLLNCCLAELQFDLKKTRPCIVVGMHCMIRVPGAPLGKKTNSQSGRKAFSYSKVNSENRSFRIPG